MVKSHTSTNSGLVLKATNSKAECSVVVVHEGIAGVEVEAAWIGTANRTAPIAAEGPDIVERTRAGVAAAR